MKVQCSVADGIIASSSLVWLGQCWVVMGWRRVWKRCCWCPLLHRLSSLSPAGIGRAVGGGHRAVVGQWQVWEGCVYNGLWWLIGHIKIFSDCSQYSPWRTDHFLDSVSLIQVSTHHYTHWGGGELSNVGVDCSHWDDALIVAVCSLQITNPWQCVNHAANVTHSLFVGAGLMAIPPTQQLAWVVCHGMVCGLFAVTSH